ncbi:MAG: hypothetical protein K2H56_03760 [Malacoplasma sp.]|nr:hypothetical protein [Malacoplasma sp.]
MKNQEKLTNLKALKLIFFIFVFGLGIFGLLFAITVTNNNIIQKTAEKNVKDLEYVRSPFAIEFQIKNTNNLKFIYALSHFDSVGVLENKNSLNEIETESEIENQGTQEIREANNIVSVLDFFTKSFNNENIIFMADTNIKIGNQNLAFKNLSKSKYKMLFEDKFTYNTTLSTTIVNEFVNPYDKFIYFLNNDYYLADKESYQDIEKIIVPNFENGFAINIYNTLDNKSYSKGIGIIDYIDGLYQNKLNGFVRNTISDHLPIGFDLTYFNQNKNISKIRIGGWNASNFNLKTDNLIEVNISEKDNLYFKKQLHAINIAKIISYSQFDLVGLLEINKNTSEKDLTYFLSYLNSLVKNSEIYYDAILSENTPAINQDSNQIEQVLLIYNKNKIITNFINKAIFYQFHLSNYLILINSFLTVNKEKSFIKEVYFEK